MLGLRVLQIISAPVAQPNGHFGVNGPEKRSANLVRRWAAHCVEPIIAYPRRGHLWDFLARSGVPLIDFEVGSKFNFRSAVQIAKIAKHFQCAVIHTQGPGSVDALACLGARLAGVPLIVTRPSMIENLYGRSYRRRQLYSIVDRFTIRYAEILIGVSLLGVHHLIQVSRANPSKVRLIHNGIELRRYQNHGHKLIKDRESLVTLGMVAQLTPVKGWFDFLRVIHLVRQSGVNAEGVIVGDGPLRNALQAEVDTMKLGAAIRFTGYQDRVERFLWGFDIFLFTSHSEGLSVAILEALAAGLPIVATDVGGIREQVIDSENGYICPAQDISGLAARVCELAGNPGMRRDFGSRSRELAESYFSEDAMLEKYAEVYHIANMK